MKTIIDEVKKEYKLQQVEEEWIEFLSIISSINPSLILEIGAYKGGSAACFAKIAKTVISIDEWMGRVDISKIEKMCEYHYINADSHSNDAIKKLEKSLNGRKIDVLFIDGDHTENGARKDFNTYKKYVKDGGIIGLHDILKSDHHKKLNCHVYKFWEELTKKYNAQAIIKDTKWGGIGVIKL